MYIQMTILFVVVPRQPYLDMVEFMFFNLRCPDLFELQFATKYAYIFRPGGHRLDLVDMTHESWVTIFSRVSS